jgi:NADPH oxidase
MVNDAGAEVDAITGLKAATNFGRPNWDRYISTVSTG